MKYFFFFISVVFFVACSQPEPSLHIPKISLNLLDTSTVFIEDIAKEISVVNLDERKEAALRFPTNFFVTDSLILIGDRGQGSVVAYDKKGNLKNKIGRRGFHIGEFRDMTDVLFDGVQNQIEVLDKTLAKIFVYNTDGRFIKTLDILNPESLGLAFAKRRNMYATFAPRGKRNKIMSRLSIYEKIGDMLSFHTSELTSFPIITELDIAFPHPIENYKDSLYYLPLLDNKIYNIGFNNAVPAYQIDVPQKNQIPNAIKKRGIAKDHFDYWKEMEKYNLIYNPSSLFITDKWISFRYDFQSMEHSRNVFYSKKTGKVLQVTEFRSRKDPEVRSRSMILAKYGDYFVIGSPVANYVEKAPKLPNPFGVNKQKQRPALMIFRLIFFKLKDF